MLEKTDIGIHFCVESEYIVLTSTCNEAMWLLRLF